tara:strand:+ start:2480 stop:2797 length:318 start_codon:yes stop_codon:yes gene_type:complete
MKSLNILYVGQHPEITTTVLRLINNREGWQGKSACNLEEVELSCAAHTFDVLLLGSGNDEAVEAVIRAYFASHFPNTKVIQHYGGGSGLLYNEILAATEHNPSAE